MCIYRLLVKMMKTFYLTVLIAVQWVSGAPAEDLITSLPGLAHLPAFKQYSGYLTASETKHFHYW